MNAIHQSAVILEPAAKDFAIATSQPPYLFEVAPEAGRKTVNAVQSGEGVAKPDVDEEWVTISGGRRAKSKLVSSKRAVRRRTFP